MYYNYPVHGNEYYCLVSVDLCSVFVLLWSFLNRAKHSSVRKGRSRNEIWHFGKFPEQMMSVINCHQIPHAVLHSLLLK
jgi:hypothetical protein